MKKIILFTLLLIGYSTCIYAQKVIEVTGLVTDAQEEPMIGVNVTVQDAPGLGAITDINGKYKIKIEPYQRLVFSYIGFEKKVVLVKEEKIVNVVLKEAEANILDEVTVTGTGIQKKVTVTGAVTTVDLKTLKTPTSSITNALAGNVAGVLARQTSGQPGNNTSEFWIRGISTFGAGTGALVLVDGFERSMDEISIEDIESFSVLKDASATAIYGSRGANGVVLITTKRGKAGKVHIDAKYEASYNSRTYTPEFADGYTYAKLMNEARSTRNQTPFYSDEDLMLIRSGLDQDLFPNVNWMDQLLKEGALTQRASININGGGTTARYFVSASYIDEGGMYKVDDTMKDYNTNANYKRWNYRMNVDMDLTKTTLVKVGVAGSLEKQNQPGSDSGQIWASLMGQNPISIPIMYSNGYVPAYGGGSQSSPWVLATQTGYIENWKNSIQTNITLEQDFKFITPGLKFIGRFGYDTYNDNYIRRVKWPAQWRAEKLRDSDGNVVFRRIAEEHLMSQESSATGSRKEFLEAELHYERAFGDHRVSGVLKYSQDKNINTSNIDDDIIKGIERRHQGVAGRFTYGWKYRYFFDFNFGYNGSENFAKGHQFGFFPAYSVAWNIAEESLIKKNLPWMDMFKLRYSYGKVGNDYMNTRFPYLAEFATWKPDPEKGDIQNQVPPADQSYNWGDIGNNMIYQILAYSRVASNAVTWEIATKHDIGLDFSLWNDKLTGSIDYFHEQRDGIFMSRNNIPQIVGLTSSPYANIGSVLSKGFDGNVGYHEKIGNVNLTLRGNITYSKNEIKETDEAYTNFPYLRQAGFRVDQAKGLVALGLFKDYEEIRNSPKQQFVVNNVRDDGSKVMPGDIRYKDINGDGVINENDIVPIGATTRPNLIYGFGASAQWKGLDFNVHFQGAGKSSFFIDGFTVYPFSSGDWGNVLKDVVESNRWILGENEDVNAKYPRLSYGGNVNNYRPSTYWLRDGSYIRLKTLEVGYTLPKSITNKIRFNNIRFFLIGTNLLTFSNFKLWDPELGSSNGQQYPLSKTWTLGLTVNL